MRIEEEMEFLFFFHHCRAGRKSERGGERERERRRSREFSSS
jgi:hypothetical protein